MPVLRTLRNVAASAAANAMLEFALIAPMFLLLFLNMVDYGRLIWARTQTNHAAQMGAQAAFKTCNGGVMPASQNCSSLKDVVTAAVQETTLGGAVNVADTYPKETYYCLSGTALISVGSYPSTRPADCSIAGSPTVTPGDYIEVAVIYLYRPICGGLSLASAQMLTSNALQRLQ